MGQTDRQANSNTCWDIAVEKMYHGHSTSTGISARVDSKHKFLCTIGLVSIINAALQDVCMYTVTLYHYTNVA